MEKILITSVIISMIALLYLIYRIVKVGIFLQILINDIKRASLLRLHYLTSKDKIVNVDSLYLFKIFKTIKKFDLIYKYPFKKLNYENILLKEDLEELNKWLNTPDVIREIIN